MQKSELIFKKTDMKTTSIFLLLVYWSIMIFAPIISNDLKMGSSRAIKLN